MKKKPDELFYYMYWKYFIHDCEILIAEIDKFQNKQHTIKEIKKTNELISTYYKNTNEVYKIFNELYDIKLP